MINGVLVNPDAVALLEYDGDTLVADALGAGGKFTFKKDDSRGQWERVGEDFWCLLHRGNPLSRPC